MQISSSSRQLDAKVEIERRKKENNHGNNNPFFSSLTHNCEIWSKTQPFFPFAPPAAIYFKKMKELYEWLKQQQIAYLESILDRHFNGELARKTFIFNRTFRTIFMTAHFKRGIRIFLLGWKVWILAQSLNFDACSISHFGGKTNTFFTRSLLPNFFANFSWSPWPIRLASPSSDSFIGTKSLIQSFELSRIQKGGIARQVRPRVYNYFLLPFL